MKIITLMSSPKELFKSRLFSPMLIKSEVPPFDSKEYLFEFKFDGARTLIYVEKEKYILQNKRKVDVTICFPEFEEIFKGNKHDMVLDSEIVVIDEKGPNFSKVTQRLLTRDKFKIERLSKTPGALVVFDILYLDGKELVDLPLLERKQILSKVVKENNFLKMSEYVLEKGKELFSISKRLELEGVVGKRIDSLYDLGKRTDHWKKIKNLLDDDFVVCGYKENEVGYNLALGQYDEEGRLFYTGHVTCYKLIEGLKPINRSPLFNFEDSKHIWVKPNIVCTVKFMARTKNRHLRQPVFKEFRLDKYPKDCRLVS